MNTLGFEPFYGTISERQPCSGVSAPAYPAPRLHHRGHATEPLSAHPSSPPSPRDATEPYGAGLDFR